MPILVFDSGFGGLSIHREIKRLRPNLTCHYLSDHQWLPYGSKPVAALQARITELVTPLAKSVNARGVVIACNTASTIALPALRAQLAIPVIGVVPAIKPAAQAFPTGTIGVLATPHTAASPYTKALVNNFAPSATVHLAGSEILVRAAERYIAGQAVKPYLIQQELHRCFPLLETLDILVLACTHFPLVRNLIAPHLPPKTQIIDSGKAIAKRVDTLISQPTELAAQYLYSTQAGLSLNTKVRREFQFDEIRTITTHHTHK